MERVTIFVVYSMQYRIFGTSRRASDGGRARDASETTARRTGIEIVRARGAPSPPHLNKTAVSCVYRVPGERERKRGWQTITNRPGDKSPGITARALLARLAGYLTPHLLRSLCRPPEPRRSTSTCPIERDEYANDVLAPYPCHSHKREVQRQHISRCDFFFTTLLRCSSKLFLNHTSVEIISHCDKKRFQNHAV